MTAVTDELRGRIVEVDFDVAAGTMTFRAEFPVLPDSRWEVLFRADESLNTYERVHYRVPREVYVPRLNSVCPVIEAGFMRGAGMGHVDAGDRLPMSELDKRELIRRAQDIGVTVAIIHTDAMIFPVLEIDTGRGTIRHEITGNESWPAVLERVGLGGTLRP